MDYGNLLSRSWSVVWNHKFMILLGFLAALGSGGGSGGNNFNFNANEGDFQNLPFVDPGFTPPDPNQILPVIGAAIAGLACIAFIVGIVLWFLRLTAEAGMIDSASRLDAGQKVSFGEAMSAGWQNIWKMIGLNILLFGGLAIVIFIVILILGLGIGASFAGAAGAGIAGAAEGAESGITGIAGMLAALGTGLIALLCCFICGLVFVGIVIGILHTFAQRAIVLENLGVFDGIRRGWNVIRENLGEVIILLIIFLALGLVVGAIVAAVFIPLGALSFGPGAMRLFSGETLSGLDIFLMVVGGLAIAIIVAAIRSFFVAFKSSAYTLAFQDFTDKNLPAIIEEKQPDAV